MENQCNLDSGGNSNLYATVPIFGKDFPWQKQFGSELEIFLVSMES